MPPARKPLHSNTYSEPSATLRMNYRDWRTIRPNGRMFHPGRTACRAALTPELAAISWQTRSGVIGSWVGARGTPSASPTALAIAAPAAVIPPSPAPLAPTGFDAEG